MRASILSIGDELILGQTLDAHAAWLSGELAARSILTLEHRTVGDARRDIAEAIGVLCARSDLLVVTGGLGPTADDLTRLALGDVIAPGQPLETDDAGLEHLDRWFKGRHRAMPKANLVQAQRPVGSKLIPNPNGTAPGIAARHGTCSIFALPGPPAEMRPMFINEALPTIQLPSDDKSQLTRSVNAFGLSESEAAERLGDLTSRDRNPLVGMTVSHSVLSAWIRACGHVRETRLLVDKTVHLVEQAWTPHVYGQNDCTLSEAVGLLLRERRLTLATAESCTGGLLGAMLVEVAGSSDYYHGGWVTYSDELKHSCLDVPEEMLETCGAVSEPVAEAMASGAVHAGGADCALSITGIAGPTGGSDEKPVGTVYIGVNWPGPHGRQSIVRHFRFPGTRGLIRDRAAKMALQMLRFALLGHGDAPLLWSVSLTMTGHRTNPGEQRAHD